MDGSVEVAPSFRGTDAIADIVGSGETAMANGINVGWSLIYFPGAYWVTTERFLKEQSVNFPIERKRLLPESKPELPFFELNYSKLFDKNGNQLVTATILDAITGKLLMEGFMNEESYKMSWELGQVVFWSRTRQELWLKGRNSGERLIIRNWEKDCDSDGLAIYVTPLGSVCHREGKFTCFEE